MTVIEIEITARLRAAADAIAVEPDLDRVVAGVMTVPVERDAVRRRRSRLVPALAVAAALVAAVVWVGSRDTTTAPVAAAPVPASAPAPGAHRPAVFDPPAWFVGDDATRTSSRRTGVWVATAIARSDGDAFTEPIVIAAFRGSTADLDKAVTVEVDGEQLRVFEVGEWREVFTNGTPTLMASGNLGVDELAAVLADAETHDVDGSLTVTVDLPDGYETIVAPQTLGEDPHVRHSLASTDVDVAIHESSDWVVSLLGAAASGGRITPVDVGGVTGWTGTTDSSYGELTWVTWSPQPGVVFEAVAANGARTVDELVDLAERTAVAAT